MREHLPIYVPAITGAVLALALWTMLARALVRRSRSRWRAVPLGLGLFLGAAGYGLYWFGFFTSPAACGETYAATCA
jgi:hypothetical protein